MRRGRGEGRGEMEGEEREGEERKGEREGRESQSTPSLCPIPPPITSPKVSAPMDTPTHAHTHTHTNTFKQRKQIHMGKSVTKSDPSQTSSHNSIPKQIVVHVHVCLITTKALHGTRIRHRHIPVIVDIKTQTPRHIPNHSDLFVSLWLNVPLQVYVPGAPTAIAPGPDLETF